MVKKIRVRIIYRSGSTAIKKMSRADYNRTKKIYGNGIWEIKSRKR